ncbi:predicted protein [Histoplasma capsulatum H143]|uniref:Uncharacterized protein n=1 Tax=Ajellomyces capsulatus (strain H143) TaxID=544712 RepID=C6HJC4_AJECH|nr:predicted protein [Histoplasma capsulatum H143]
MSVQSQSHMKLSRPPISSEMFLSRPVNAPANYAAWRRLLSPVELPRQRPDDDTTPTTTRPTIASIPPRSSFQDDPRVCLLQSSQDLRQGKPPVVSIMSYMHSFAPEGTGAGDGE